VSKAAILGMRCLRWLSTSIAHVRVERWPAGPAV